MKDSHYIILFTAVGLALAFVVSKPLRQPANTMPRVGTPMSSMEEKPAVAEKEARVYAEGTIALGGGISEQKAANEVLFIFVRPAVDGKVTAGGPPIAVKRIPSPIFPLNFSLTNANNMIGTDFYDGDIAVVVRLDADGMAGPKRADDTEVSSLVSAKGPRDIQITLSR